MHRRKRSKKSKITVSRILSLFVTVAVTVGIIAAGVGVCTLLFPDAGFKGYIPAAFGKMAAKNVKIAQGLELPDWIDSQVITIHSTARTGTHLTDINAIVVHYVGNPNTSAQNNRDYFNKLDTDVSSHFVIGLEGEIIQCVPLWEKSAASNSRNSDTISIEVCHPDASGKFTDESYNSLIKLISWICRNFKLDENDVIRHYDITKKICPKYYVENPQAFKQLKRDVKKELE